MNNGVLTNLPFLGGVWDQPPDLLDYIATAWRAWYVFGYKPKNNIKWTPEDAEFMAWIDGDG
jgi:hypothetical protein